jgi:hypothetical protein
LFFSGSANPITGRIEHPFRIVNVIAIPVDEPTRQKVERMASLFERFGEESLNLIEGIDIAATYGDRGCMKS